LIWTTTSVSAAKPETVLLIFRTQSGANLEP
jgi:hypothetical protein